MLSNASRAVVIVSSIFSLVATLAVVLRFYARRLKLQPFQADDYLVLLALVCARRTGTSALLNITRLLRLLSVQYTSLVCKAGVPLFYVF